MQTYSYFGVNIRKYNPVRFQLLRLLIRVNVFKKDSIFYITLQSHKNWHALDSSKKKKFPFLPLLISDKKKNNDIGIWSQGTTRLESAFHNLHVRSWGNSGLVPFIFHNVFKVYACCRMCQNFLPF